MQAKNPSTPLLTEKRPNEVRFIYTNTLYFLYVTSEKKTDTFGLSLEDTIKMMENLQTRHAARISVRPDRTSRFTDNVKEYISEIKSIVTEYKKRISNKYENLDTSQVNDFINRFADTHFVPYFMRFTGKNTHLMTEITAESILKMGLPPASYHEAEKYIAKHLVMMKIGKALEAIRGELKKEVGSQDQEELTFIEAALNNIVDENLKNIPPYELFFYYPTFILKISSFIKSFKKMNIPLGDLIESDIRDNDQESFDNYEKFKKLSSKIYERLANFYEEMKLIFADSPEQVRSKENEDLLYVFLGVLEILNSPNNPFARNGLLGEELTSTLHTNAKKELKRYEENMFKSGKENIKLEVLLDSPPPAEIICYDMDQRHHLLFGSRGTQAKRSTLSSFFGTSAQTQTRQQRLSLPAPKIEKERHLLLLTTSVSNSNVSNTVAREITKPEFVSFDPNTLVGKLFIISQKYRDEGKKVYLRIVDYIDTFAYHIRNEPNAYFYITVLTHALRAFLKAHDSERLLSLVDDYYKSEIGNKLGEEFSGKFVFANNDKEENKTTIKGSFTACLEDLEKYYNLDLENPTYNFSWIEKVVIPQISSKTSNENKDSSSSVTTSNNVTGSSVVIEELKNEEQKNISNSLPGFFANNNSNHALVIPGTKELSPEEEQELLRQLDETYPSPSSSLGSHSSN